MPGFQVQSVDIRGSAYYVQIAAWIVIFHVSAKFRYSQAVVPAVGSVKFYVPVALQKHQLKSTGVNKDKV